LSDTELKVEFARLTASTPDAQVKSLCEAFLNRFEVKEEVSRTLAKTIRTNGPS
jgi:hypothetical protein